MPAAETHPHDKSAELEYLPLTDLSWLERGAQFPPKSEEKRLERYARNRALWKGFHDGVYGNWWRVLREDKAASLELVFNWHKRLSTLWADLLVGEPPRFLDGDDSEEGAAGHDQRQETIDRLSGKDDNGYVSTLYKTALDVSRYGDGLVKVTLEEEGAQIWSQPPSYWFPVVDPNNMHRATQHVLAWKFQQRDQTYLRVEIHEIGLIQHRVFHLEGNNIGDEMRISDFLPGVPTGIEYTFCDDFLVVPFPGLVPSDEMYGVDDYTDVDSIIQALEVRAGQINRVLDKHTDPSMYGPSDLLSTNSKGETVFQAADMYFEVGEDDVPPGYVTWDGQLEAQFQEVETLIKQLYVISETSPAAFGQLESGLAESGSALRRLMQAPLAKVARIRMNFDPAAKRALIVAAQLEAKNGRPTPEIPRVTIQWQDGLPPDPKEQAETEELRKRGGNTSTVSSIRRLDGGTLEEAEAEYERIQEELEAEAERAMAEAEHATELATKEGTALGGQEGSKGKTPGKPGAANSGSKKKEGK